MANPESGEILLKSGQNMQWLDYSQEFGDDCLHNAGVTSMQMGAISPKMHLLVQPEVKMAEKWVEFADSIFWHGGRDDSCFRYGPTGMKMVCGKWRGVEKDERIVIELLLTYYILRNCFAFNNTAVTESAP